MPLTPADFDAPLAQCPLCQTTRIAPYDHDYRGCFIHRCRACGVKFMNAPYTDAYLAEYYANYVDEFQAEHGAEQLQRRVVSKEYDLRWIEQYTAPGRFLAIGCGDGMEMQVAQRMGWQPEGFDVDQATTLRVAREINLPVFGGDFFQIGFPANTYDCVFMDQVLEHPKNPQDYLREVHRILKPGGVLYIGCPNIMSASNMFKTALGKLGLNRRSRGKHYGTFHHLFYYSPWQLARALEKHFHFDVLTYEGSPLGGVKNAKETGGWLSRLNIHLRRKLPILESTFRLLARKPDSGVPQPSEAPQMFHTTIKRSSLPRASVPLPDIEERPHATL